jgi:hypothetical protein
LFEALRPWSTEQLKAQHGKQGAMDGAPFFYARQPGKKLVAELQTTVLGKSVRELVVHAKTGCETTFDPIVLTRTIVDLTRYVYPPSPEETIVVVELLSAAVTARDYLGRGKPVTAHQIAALGSVTADHVNLLARTGKVERLSHGLYEPASVARWLESRYV